ncbi:MAG: hypothetical protein MJZ98_00420 [Paludibacteraceae bacterium]|nr:hypothetical protein [Paludibacteraceae bacterium]
MSNELNEQLTTQLIVILERYFDRIGQLLIQSEKRIDQTNEIVRKLAETEHKLTETYSGHINNLVDSHNEIIMQNKELILHNKRLMDLVENAQRMEETKNKEHYELLHIIASFTESKHNVLTIANKAQTI